MFEKLARGSLRLTRFILRRERFRIIIWAVCLIGITLAVPFAFDQMFNKEGTDTAGMAVAAQNPSMIAMIGPSEGFDNYTVGVMNAHMMLVFMAIAVAIMNIFFVIRYARRDEELGRQEVMRSLPVGHLSPLTATLLVAVIMNVIVGLGCGLGLAALGIESIDLPGSILYGITLTTIGLVFAGVAAVFAQLCQTARGATGLSMAFMIGSYLLRAVGDMNNEVLSRISPLGLIIRTEAAVNNYWWPVFILLAVAIVLFVKAFWLNSIRDMDQGFIPARSGKSRASKILVRPTGLSLRLMRGTIIAWVLGMVLLGASYGSILGDTEAFSDIVAQVTGGVIKGGDMTRTFVSVLMKIMAICATIPCLIMVLKLRTEERRGRLEGLLAAPVSRRRIFNSYVLPALIFSVVAPILTAIGLYGASAPSMETPIAFGDLVWSVVVFMPAIWMTIGLATVLVALLPRRTSLIWAFLTFSFFVIYLGNMINMPGWVGQLTPFGHVSETLVDNTNYPPLIITSVLAIALLFAGSKIYQRRDMVK